MPTIQRIVSGGQTGADRAALDVARKLGIDYGGWVPAGRWAEDGPIPARYTGLRETTSAEPAERTALNVRDSDATLVVTSGPAIGGTAHTIGIAMRFERALLHLDLVTIEPTAAAAQLSQWLEQHSVRTLNVAGPRASEDPAIGPAVRSLLLTALPRGS